MNGIDNMATEGGMTACNLQIQSSVYYINYFLDYNFQNSLRKNKRNVSKLWFKGKVPLNITCHKPTSLKDLIGQSEQKAETETFGLTQQGSFYEFNQ